MGRRARSKDVAAAREQGLEVALGVEPVVDHDEGARRISRRCPHCGTRGRIDMVDTSAKRAYLSCDACGCNWDTDSPDAGD